MATTEIPPMDAGVADLPSLPVPDLEDTLEAYLDTVRPLLQSSEDFDFAYTEKVVAEFAAKEGPVLQKLLEAKAAEAATRGSSWLIDWWNAWAYDSGRVSVCFAVNYCLGFRRDPRAPSQLQRAANLTHAALRFRELVKTRQLAPDAARGKVFCMEQFDYLFHGMKLPGERTDTTVTHSIHEHGHFAVVCRGRFYEVPIYEADGTPLSPLSLLAHLTRIREHADAAGEGSGMGVLTAQDRDTWFQDFYSTLRPLPGNEASLDRLETAAFLLALDDARPSSHEEMSRACWHGVDPANRYFDKCFQLLVFANGEAGINGEHSRADGTATARMARDIVLMAETMDLPRPTDTPVAGATSALELPIFVDAALAKAIARARAFWAAEVRAHDVWVLRYAGYGKDLIKRFKVSPDAYVQMALQLAYHRMYGTSRATYESAATRKYASGRTETCRSVSSESVAWVEAMADDSGISWPEKEKLLRKAIGVHSKRTVKAVEGKGVDRHLLGLRLLAQEHSMPTPPIFADPAFAESSHWYLSTSQIAEPTVQTYAWGQVVDEGYGCAYMIHDDVVQVNVCSRSRNSGQFGRWLEIALIDMRRVMEEGPKAHHALRPPVHASTKGQQDTVGLHALSFDVDAFGPMPLKGPTATTAIPTTTCRMY